MAIRKILFPILLSLPLVIATTIGSVSHPNSTTSTHNALSKVAVARPLISTINNHLPTNNKTPYFMTVNPGEKYVYERKVTIMWGFGDRVIQVFGHITNFPLNRTTLINRGIFIQAVQNNQTIL